MREIEQRTLSELGLEGSLSGVYDGQWRAGRAGTVDVVNPATGEVLASVGLGDRADYDACVERACDAFRQWRITPPPARGELIRRLGNELRKHKKSLGMLVTLEAGKIVSEGQGEVQEMIDMCDFGVGLSRQLYGLTIASERPHHRLFEQWHPLGPVGIITSFNFPVAVWAWNSAVATVCGDPTLWKPSPRTPLTAIAVMRICEPILREFELPGLMTLCLAEGIEPGGWMADDVRLPLISATGSCRMGKALAPRVASRLGRSLLELGGNNAAIVTESADMELVVRAVVFAAVGTAGQRCTTLRRLFVHRSTRDALVERLVHVYRQLPIGDPWDEKTLVGPLIGEEAVGAMERALEQARAEGGEVVCGGERLDRKGYFVTPAIVVSDSDLPVSHVETFAPILYVRSYDDFDEAIRWNNDVPQGLSSAVFTERLKEAERFLSPAGSDCGIANVNIGTSGAEIGGAFGGEKETGGGREAGSDAWKAYMRRQTCTINYGSDLPLAQGIRFDI